MPGSHHGREQKLLGLESRPNIQHWVFAELSDCAAPNLAPRRATPHATREDVRQFAFVPAATRLDFRAERHLHCATMKEECQP